MIPKLHIRQDKADWDYVRPADRTRLQRVAANSNGLFTPANIITLLGLLVSLYGFGRIADAQVGVGLAFVIIGRLADILDGVVADRTNTKSATGELMDLVADKITVAVGLLVCLVVLHIPWFVIIFIAVQNILTSIAGIYVKLRGLKLHPVRSGKYAMALSWIVLGLFIIESQQNSTLLTSAAWISFACYAIVGLIAACKYPLQIKRHKSA